MKSKLRERLKWLTNYGGLLMFGYAGYRFVHSGDALGAFFAGAAVVICINGIKDMDQEYCDCATEGEKVNQTCTQIRDAILPSMAKPGASPPKEDLQ